MQGEKLSVEFLSVFHSLGSSPQNRRTLFCSGRELTTQTASQPDQCENEWANGFNVLGIVTCCETLLDFPLTVCNFVCVCVFSWLLSISLILHITVASGNQGGKDPGIWLAAGPYASDHMISACHSWFMQIQLEPSTDFNQHFFVDRFSLFYFIFFILWSSILKISLTLMERFYQLTLLSKS